MLSFSSKPFHVLYRLIDSHKVLVMLRVSQRVNNALVIDIINGINLVLLYRGEIVCKILEQKYALKMNPP